MSARMPPDPPGFYGPPYFEIHPEGWAIIIVVLALVALGIWAIT